MAIGSSNYPGIVCASIVWMGIAAVNANPAMGGSGKLKFIE